MATFNRFSSQKHLLDISSQHTSYCTQIEGMKRGQVKRRTSQRKGLPRWLSGKEPAYECKEMQFPPLCQENPLEKEMATHSIYPCLENPMDRGAWQATVHRIGEKLDITQQLNKKSEGKPKNIAFIGESLYHSYLEFGQAVLIRTWQSII